MRPMLSRQPRLAPDDDPVTIDVTPTGVPDLPPDHDLDDLVAALDRALLRLARGNVTRPR
ncbi:MAG: hypothetical protein ACLGIE_05365 [Alphaproteobacteria bacterium]